MYRKHFDDNQPFRRVSPCHLKKSCAAKTKIQNKLCNTICEEDKHKHQVKVVKENVCIENLLSIELEALQMWVISKIVFHGEYL